MTLAKALGNSTAVGAIEQQKEIAKALCGQSCLSYFWGNPRRCTHTSAAVFETIEAEGLLVNAARWVTILLSNWRIYSPNESLMLLKR